MFEKIQRCYMCAEQTFDGMIHNCSMIHHPQKHKLEPSITYEDPHLDIMKSILYELQDIKKLLQER